MKITGKIEKYSNNNLQIRDNLQIDHFFYIPSDNLIETMKSYPQGTIVTLADKVKQKGTVDWMRLPNKEEWEKFTVIPPTPAAIPLKDKDYSEYAVNKEKTVKQILQENLDKNVVEKSINPPLTPEEDVWMKEQDEFKNLLLSTKRDGIGSLLDYLEKETDFFVAPSSTKYHDARGGGLLHHSIEVLNNLIKLSPLFEPGYPAETLIIIGLLHDLCKANFYKTSFRNVKHEERPYGDQWVKEPYIDIDDQFPLGHGEKSVILIQRYIKLTDLEIMAIRWHMMAYDDLHYSYAGNIAITGASSKYPIIVLMHIADLSASFLTERARSPPAKAGG